MDIPFNPSTIAELSAAEPGWLQNRRRDAWRTFTDLPLPTRRDLEWQPFNLKALDLAGLDAGWATKPAITVQLAGLGADQARAGVILAELREAVRRHPDLVRRHLGAGLAPTEPRKFHALHFACWQTGALLYVPRDVRLSSPLEITYAFHGDRTAGFPHTLIVLEPGAEATVIQRFQGGPSAAAAGPASLHASGTEVFVGEGARLHCVSLQDFGPNLFDFTAQRARVGRDAQLDWVLAMVGASFQRCDVECQMEGPGGSSSMYAVGVGDRQQQFGQFTRQHHQAGDTVSDLLFKNVLRDSAVTNYAGTIKVEKNANGTNAYQSNRNLTLSDKVRCDTRPILEIESNQLRCTHGATVGQLDDEQLFYLRSRGLPAAQARNLLIEAFIEPVLERIRIEEVQSEFRKLIHGKVIRE